jgi:hypothetical protein
MNRLISTIFVLAMMLLAVFVCVRQTLIAGDSLGDAAKILLAAEVLAAVGVLAVLGLLSWRLLPVSRRSTGGQRFEAFRSLRRIVAAVWS